MDTYVCVLERGMEIIERESDLNRFETSPLRSRCFSMEI